MSWQSFSLHFRQHYEGGYRYLDKCGEFMLTAVEDCNFIAGEIKPTGAKIEMPERSLVATVDTQELTVRQDLPDDKDDFFFHRCEELVALVQTHFKPTR